jgi:hypothetical protein
MRTLGLCALIAVLLPFSLVAAEDDKWAEWKVAYDKNGLKVEARKNKATGVIQTRATARLGCSTDRLWNLLVNDDSFLRFMPDMPESRRIGDVGRAGEGWWYQRIAKAAISDRDFILHVRWTIEKTPLGRKYYRWWSIDDEVGPPPKENVLRLHVNNGSWSFTPVEGGETDFEYINYIELEGVLWKAITNRAAKSNTIQFLENLDEECRIE